MSLKSLNDSNFASETATGTHLVDFFAEWCGPCKAMEPVITALATEIAPAIETVKVDIDQAPKAARQAGIRSVPTFALMKDGHIIATRTGSSSRQDLRSWIEANLAA